MEDAPSLLKIPKSECPNIWIRVPKHKWPRSWSGKEDPVVAVERNLYSHPLARLSMEKAIRESSTKKRLGTSSKLEMYSLTEKKAVLVSVCERSKTGWNETEH